MTGRFPLTRRQFTATTIASSAWLALGATAFTRQTPAASPVPGETVDALTTAMEGLLQRWGLPGAQLAVGHDGMLVYNAAFGLADVEAAEPVTTGSRFRIASVSKTITAVGILHLVDQGALTLDTAVFPLLALEPPPGAELDPRLDQITVRDLLIHAGGWNSAASGDPQYIPLAYEAAGVVGVEAPPQGIDIIRFMLGSSLDFDPGSQAAYSNFGFNVLGRVIEHVSGVSYEEYIQANILAPAGITDMQLGKTRLADRAPNEVRYYQPPEYPATVPSVFPGEGYVPFAYGSFFMDAMDSHGGWIATAADLVRYALAIDGQRGEPLLQPATIETMLTTLHPEFIGYNGAANDRPATGLGWVIQPGPLGQQWAHTGALGGSTSALLLRTDGGLALAYVTNSLPADFIGYFADLESTLTETLASIRAWPTTDLFAD
jgi:N-acyl-D-amino-acid deacylase